MIEDLLRPPVDTDDEALKNAFQVLVRNSMNVNQWRAKLVNIFQLTQIQAQAFGSRDAACAECFRLCPFA